MTTSNISKTTVNTVCKSNRVSTCGQINTETDFSMRCKMSLGRIKYLPRRKSINLCTYRERGSKIGVLVYSGQCGGPSLMQDCSETAGLNTSHRRH